MDSYGSSELQTEAASQGTDERSNPDQGEKSRWHPDDDRRGHVGSPRRMDSGYADPVEGNEEEGKGSGTVKGNASPDRDVSQFSLEQGGEGGEGSGSTHKDKSQQGVEEEQEWDCTDILAQQEGEGARYALVVLNQAMPARWVFEQVWKSGAYEQGDSRGRRNMADIQPSTGYARTGALIDYTTR
jgi:hypothetical protein